MFGMGWTELMVVGIVALIVVGPKDLPVLFRNMGQFVGKARGMAREFSRAMEQAADESGVRDVAKGLKTATNPVGSAMDGVRDAARSMTRIDPDSETGKLSKERAEAAEKIRTYSAEKARERRAAEAAAESGGQAGAESGDDDGAEAGPVSGPDAGTEAMSEADDPGMVAAPEAPARPAERTAAARNRAPADKSDKT